MPQWKGFMATLAWIGKGIIWQVGNGESIFLGADPFVGMGSSFSLPRGLRDYLEDYGICTLAQARNQTPNATGYWFSVDDLDLIGDWKTIWDNYVRGLEFGRIQLTDQNDILSQSHDKYTGPLTAAEGYSCVISDCCPELNDKVLKILWTVTIPLKIKCFIWLLIYHKILTWEQLQSRGFYGPSRCVLCEGDKEDIQHLFFAVHFQPLSIPFMR